MNKRLSIITVLLVIFITATACGNEKIKISDETTNITSTEISSSEEATTSNTTEATTSSTEQSNNSNNNTSTNEDKNNSNNNSNNNNKNNNTSNTTNSNDGKTTGEKDPSKLTQTTTNSSSSEEKTLAQNIINQIITKNMSDFDKAKAIHDYILMNVDYDYANYLKDTIPSQSYTALGALKYKYAVCAGYAKLFQLMCQLSSPVNYLPDN